MVAAGKEFSAEQKNVSAPADTPMVSSGDRILSEPSLKVRSSGPPAKEWKCHVHVYKDILVKHMGHLQKNGKVIYIRTSSN